jgi:hypothetical protein
MNTVNRSKCAVATSQNWIGSTTKNASTKLRWSPRRVGESVMNSRRAKKATMANSVVATPSPDAQPTQNTITIAQEVRSKASSLRQPGVDHFRLRCVAPFAQRQHEHRDMGQ